MILKAENGDALGRWRKRPQAKEYRGPLEAEKVRKISWRREWQPTPVLLPRKFHGQRSLVGYSPWDHKESDTTE